MAVALIDPNDYQANHSVAGAQASLNQAVSALGPMATTWHATQPLTSYGETANFQPGPSGLSKATTFLGHLAVGVGHMAGAATSFLTHSVEDMVASPLHFGADLGNLNNSRININADASRADQLSGQLDNLDKQFKSGQITQKEYLQGLKGWQTDNEQLRHELSNDNARLSAQGKATVHDSINVAAAVTTVLTAGFGAVADSGIQTTGAWLKSQAADVYLRGGEAALSRTALSPKLVNSLGSTARSVIERSAAEVAAGSSASMTSGQIARATISNLAFKYPVYYNLLSETGSDIYKELDNQKYGSAVAQVALNAGFLLAGGPIGWAFKQGGKLVKAANLATFGRSSFIDELSGMMFGDKEVIYRAISSIEDPALRKDVIEKISHMEATNLAAVGGTEYVAAAQRVIEGMKSAYGLDLTGMAPEEARTEIMSMYNHFKAQSMVDKVAQRLKLTGLTVGRFDPKMRADIAKKLGGKSSVEERLAKWESMKKNSPNQAWANNPYVDKQMKQLIETHPGGDLGKAINAIDTRFAVPKGFTAAERKELSKLGYIPIKPKSLAAPFREGEGKLTTAFAGKTYGAEVPQGVSNTGFSAPLPKNVYRGVDPVSAGAPGSATRLGNGLYTTANKGYAKNYGEVSKLGSEALPKNPLQFDSHYSLSKWVQRHNPNIDPIDAGDDLTNLVKSMGHDGITIGKGKDMEIVKYTGAPGVKGVGDELFIKMTQPLPVLGHIGSLLTGMGLSPNASSARTYQLFNIALADNLKGLPLTEKLAADLTAKASDKELPTSVEQASDYIIKKLSSYARKPESRLIVRTPITDLRQLTVKDIAKALDVSSSQARDIRQGIDRAMFSVPLAVRGLGDKVVDASYPVLRKYLRAQGVGRFAINPFFQYLRLIPKTEILTEAKGGGILKTLFSGRWGEVQKLRGTLREAGAFDEAPAKALGEAVSGDEAIVTGRNLGRKLLPAQETSIAGLVDSMAEKAGMDAHQFVRENPDQVRDVVQAVAQYDKHSNFLNSPLIKTLNVAVFPLRFETKVAGVMAKALSQAAPLTQVAFLHGMFKAHDFLNSAEGAAWYAANAEAVGLFNYITPIASLTEVMETLLPGHDHHLGNFGELGGLPFGFIPLILDSQGITHFKQPGVNARTGAIYKEYLPINDRGRVASALSDFLSTLFSYPGATAGLPSKGGITRAIANKVTGATRDDFQAVTPEISSAQQTYINNITHSGGPVALQDLQPRTDNFKPIDYQAALPDLRPSTGPPRAGRKSSYSPYLLPGQEYFGQL